MCSPESGKTKTLLCLVVTACIILALSAISRASGPSTLTVFAAASTTNAITDITELFEDKTGQEVSLSFASSSTLAKQIEMGAPARVYLSANPDWMDYLEEKGLIQPGSRTDLLGNRIVLIAPASGEINEVKIGKGFGLAGMLGDGYLAMGDPDHVPAGMYGKAALRKLGAWDAVEKKVARAKDVRAALALVERGEAPLGLVYATDAAISDKVKVVGIFPVDSHPPIVYPAAIVKGADLKTARAYIEFLRTPEASAIFKQYGFTAR